MTARAAPHARPARPGRPRAHIRGRPRGGLWWRAPCALAIWLVFAAPAAACGAAWITVHRASADVPETPDLERYAREAPQTSAILAADGAVTARLPFSEDGVVGRREIVAYGDIPDLVVRAFLAAEDRRFFDHGGVDPAAITRAALANYQAGDIVEGGSTITQQLARALRPDAIGRARTLSRKLREALLAREIEARYSKERIFEVYANHVFLGAGAYGVSEAARAYFDAPLAELTPAQAATLAGLAQAPGRADPYSAPERARERRDEVLRRMREAEFLDEGAYRRARASDLDLTPPSPRYGRAAPWHTERARREVAAELPAAYRRGGLRIETTAEPALDGAARERAREHAEALAGDAGVPELAAVVWDHRTDYVALSLGGRDFGESEFDRAYQACRQPGSALKPIAYAAALEMDAITAGTPLRDAPIVEYDAELGVFWKPDAGGGRYRGVALARDALAHSLNPPAVEVYSRAGGRRVRALAERLGIETELEPVAPLALGASCVVPIELTAAFATWPRGGVAGDPIYVKRVTRAGEVLIDRTSPLDPDLPAGDRLARLAATTAEEPPRVQDERTSFIMVDMLRAVVERGTGAGARALGREAAGKTGTTNRYADAWFVGFSAGATGTVWLGHDDPARSLGAGRTGGEVALPLWVDVMDLAVGDRPQRPLVGEAPAGVIEVRVDPETGLLAAPGGPGERIFFKRGTEPTERADAPRARGSDLGDLSREF